MMDFDAINTKADAERGAKLHFTHPQLGHLLYTGEGADAAGRLIDATKAEPVFAIVRGLESPAIREKLKAVNAAKALGAGDDKSGFDLAIALVISLHGVTRGGNPVAADRDGLEWLFGKSEHFAAQVINFAGVSANFFSEPARG